MRLVQTYRVTDSTGSEIRLYEYRATETRRILGVIPLRRAITLYRLDTGEDVERHPRHGHFSVKRSGELLVCVDWPH